MRVLVIQMRVLGQFNNLNEKIPHANEKHKNANKWTKIKNAAL